MPTEYVLTSRPEVARAPVPDSAFGVVESRSRPGAHLQRGGVRKLAILLLLALAWEVYARILDNALLFPTFSRRRGIR